MYIYTLTDEQIHIRKQTTRVAYSSVGECSPTLCKVLGFNSLHSIHRAWWCGLASKQVGSRGRKKEFNNVSATQKVKASLHKPCQEDTK